jgi:hypothetical protein
MNIASGLLRRGLRIALAIAAGAGFAAAAAAQQSQPFAYPNGGQSQEQQSRDRYECHQWAVAQVGFDPVTAPPVPAPQAAAPPPAQGYSDQPPPAAEQKSGFLGLGNGGFFRGGGVVGDAATGAALGAAGGAIAGDAGTGAAIGALASTVFGAVSRSTTPNPPAANPAAPPQPQGYGYYQQPSAAYEQRQRQVADYNGAFGACMKGRNYTVN